MGIIKEIVLVDKDEQNPAHILYERLQHTKRMVGMGLFSMGAILYYFKEHDLWKGYAEDWGQFCASESIPPTMGRLSIRIYKKYVLELGLEEKELALLAERDYTTLDNACKVITPENAEEWLPKIMTLGREDVGKEIREAQGREVFQSSEIDKVEAMFWKLNSDAKVEFRRRIGS